MGRIAATVDFLASSGSRLTGYPGNSRAADFIEASFLTSGLTSVRREELHVAVPVELGSELHVEETGETVVLHGLWPNHVRTTTLPSAGLRLPLVYGGTAEYADFEGQELVGSAVLMEFDSWGRWRRAAGFGARAVIFIAPEETTYGQTVGKSSTVPLNLPRFWIGREDGLRLRRRLASGQELNVVLHSRMDWEERPTWNIWGIIPGNDEQLREERVVVEAYYDGISVVPALAPSAETACSIVALLELGRHLQRNPPSRTVILAATGAHFQGRRGMIEFLDRHARKNDDYAERMDVPLDADLFIHLDLSSRTDQLAIWNNSISFDLKRFFVPFGRRFTRYAERVASQLDRNPTTALLNGISPIRGIDWPTLVPGSVPSNGVASMSAGQVALSFVTAHDSRLGINSPLDTAELLEVDNLASQIALINGMFSLAFADDELLSNLEEFDPVIKDELRNYQVRVRAFPRRSQLPDRQIGSALVSEGWSRTRKGMHWVRHYLTDEGGDAMLRGLGVGHTASVSAYVLDPETGDIRLATDVSLRAQKHSGAPSYSGKIKWDVRWTGDIKVLVVFPCMTGELYGLEEAYGDLKVIDESGRAPRQFGFARSFSEDACVMFADRDADDASGGLKLLMGSFLLLNSGGNSDEASARGSGYRMGHDTLIPTRLLAVRDAWNLNQARLNTMRENAIENQRLVRYHTLGERLIQEASTALEERRWEDYVARVRAAAGVTANAYPEVLGTLNDVIKGMVFFLALVIPAAFFSERLVMASADIRWQLAGFFACLVLIWAVISQVHPAFAIAHPLIILLAFAIMAMAVFVLLMVTTRFNRHMREYQAEQAKVHQTDISRVSAAYTAFMLGISNMRRRKLRTGLTLTTITLLTFTVLSFTSFKPEVRFFAFPQGHDGAYEGALLRDRSWDWFSDEFIEYARAHFGQDADLLERRWYIANRMEEKKYIQVRYRGHLAFSTALLGLSRGENRATGIERTLVAGSFFESDSENSCLLSTDLAHNLGMKSAPAFGDSVRILGRMLRVRGLFDAEAFGDVRDLDNQQLTPVDFQRSTAELMPGARVAEDIDENLETRSFMHLSPEGVVILPSETLKEEGGDLRSVAVLFDEEANLKQLIEDFLERIGVSLYVGQADADGAISVASYTSLGITAVEGIQSLFIPLLIAGLIVLNAMLGAVYERFREIDIYSAVGLAPMHIALLFVAEACVYAVIGVTAGYLFGQTLGKVLISLDLMQGMSLNYSSMAAIASAAIVMAVVMASTFYPARVASRSAVPDTVRRWKPPPPDGDRWEFEFPFMVSEGEVLGMSGFLISFFDSYSEESIGDFYAEKVALSTGEGEFGPEYSVQMLTWLAPFDMGVSQFLQLDFVPGDSSHGIYIVEVFIQRLSGQDTYWQRVNQRFMNTLRKQFLLWHTMDSASREYHRVSAEERLNTRVSS